MVLNAKNVTSALVAGLIAFVFYTGIALITGSGAGSALGVGLLFFLGTAAITMLIMAVIISTKKSRSSR